MSILLPVSDSEIVETGDVDIVLRPDWTYRVTRRKTDSIKRLDITVSKSTQVRVNGAMVP
jgi:hypothetical protein